MQIQNVCGVWYVLDRKNQRTTKAQTAGKAIEQALLKYFYVYR